VESWYKQLLVLASNGFRLLSPKVKDFEPRDRLVDSVLTHTEVDM